MISERDTLLGEEIDGYYIEKLIGQGGMARVYRGRDVRLGRNIVIKVIQPSARANEDYRERFEVEAQAIALLEHPHIVHIYRFGEVGDLYYMAMQYIEGVDLSSILKDYIDDNELLPHTDMLRIVSQVSSALDYAHSKGIIHRDIKPANIMLDVRGNATLTDFGLALLQVKGSHGEIFGTPHYMAPEQAVNSAGAVPQSDLYSLGVILYEMLTGSLPFNGNSALEIAMLHMTEQPSSPHERNPSLHPAFVPFLEKALQKEPANRYQSGKDLSIALREAIDAASSTPQPTEETLLHISHLKVPEKVSKIRQSQPLLPPRAAGFPLSHKLAVPKIVIPHPMQMMSSQQRGQRRTWLLVGAIVAAAVACGTLMVLLLTLFSGETGEIGPTMAASEQAATSDSTVTSPITIEPTPITPTTSAASQVVPSTTAIPATDVPSSPTRELPTTTPVLLTAIPLSPTPGAITVPPTAVALRFVTDGEDSLYVMNISPLPFNLGLLELRGAQSGGVVGAEWGVATLNNQECVRVEKDENPRPPDVTCSVVGDLITREGPARFWTPEYDSFEVYYAGILIGNCSTAGCILPMPASSP